MLSALVIKDLHVYCILQQYLLSPVDILCNIPIQFDVTMSYLSRDGIVLGEATSVLCLNEFSNLFLTGGSMERRIRYGQVDH